MDYELKMQPNGGDPDLNPELLALRARAQHQLRRYYRRQRWMGVLGWVVILLASYGLYALMKVLLS